MYERFCFAVPLGLRFQDLSAPFAGLRPFAARSDSLSLFFLVKSSPNRFHLVFSCMPTIVYLIGQVLEFFRRRATCASAALFACGAGFLCQLEGQGLARLLRAKHSLQRGAKTSPRMSDSTSP